MQAAAIAAFPDGRKKEQTRREVISKVDAIRAKRERSFASRLKTGHGT
jgi:hypothetical protein